LTATHFVCFSYKIVTEGIQRNCDEFGGCILLDDLDALKSFSFHGGFHLGEQTKYRWCEVRRIRWVADFQHPVIHHNFLGASVMILFHTPGKVVQLRNTVINPN
jgi:hypothetical protein